MAKLTAPNSQNALTTELNSLANGSAAIGASAVDNTANLDPFGALACHFVFASAPTAGTTMDLYLVPTWDGGTTYETTSSNLPQAAWFLGSVTLPSNATTQDLTLPGIDLIGIKFKVAVKNNSGVALAASASTVALKSWQTQ